MQLIIGNKNYSSWSLRAWLLLTTFNLEFEEVQESLRQDTHEGSLKGRLGKYSPTSRVPVLIDNQLTVWDSLAIGEYVSEQYLGGKGWPADVALRAEARAICAEMHSGFMGLRCELPMNCRATRQVTPSEAAKQDIARIDEIWSHCMTHYEGPWLFGNFSIADSFYAPVVLRFQTYGISLSEAANRYQAFALQYEALNKWVDAGKAETEIVPEDETGIDVS
ncbi:MAG: glutathione S-transferase family protein [Cyanobacteria bacterium P01_F01_bin.53]